VSAGREQKSPGASCEGAAVACGVEKETAARPVPDEAELGAAGCAGPLQPGSSRHENQSL